MMPIAADSARPPAASRSHRVPGLPATAGGAEDRPTAAGTMPGFSSPDRVPFLPERRSGSRRGMVSLIKAGRVGRVAERVSAVSVSTYSVRGRSR